MSSVQGGKRGKPDSVDTNLERLPHYIEQQPCESKNEYNMHEDVRNQQSFMYTQKPRTVYKNSLLLSLPVINLGVHNTPPVNISHFPSGSPNGYYPSHRQCYQPMREEMVQTFTPDRLTSKPALRVAQKQNNVPVDSRWLRDEGNMVPESNICNIVKWLDKPMNSTPPCSVTKIHEMLDEWDAPWETKVAQINDWLFEKIDTKEYKKEDQGPKVVVVEHRQLFGGWSAMEE